MRLKKCPYLQKLGLLSAFILGSTPLFSQSFDLRTKQIQVFSTEKNTQNRLSEVKNTWEVIDFAQPKETDICVFINPSKSFQTFEGIGGAITDAAAETFAKLPKAKQQEFLTAYFDKEKGIGYSLLRTNINSCDFSSDTYVYVKENDKELTTFSLKHDEQFKMPLIKQAKERMGADFKLFVSPWSPPAWMKSNNNMLQGGRLMEAFYPSWANYYVKFIQGYEKTGIPVWGLTIQNEPMATQRWESCIYTADEETAFLRDHLGPMLHKNQMGDKKVIIWDHNRDLIFQRASVTLSDPTAAKYVWGIGFHWYENWTGSENMYDNVEETHKAFPDKSLIFTEGCKEKFELGKIKDWSLGELYGTSMIQDFNNGVSAWTDWNILLNEQGGPNHVGNYCFAPVIGNTQTGEVSYTAEYQYIGHFSKFIRPGAKRVSSSTNRDFLMATSFQNKDGNLVVVVMNKSEKDTDFHLWIAGKALKTKASARSISTFVMK